MCTDRMAHQLAFLEHAENLKNTLRSAHTSLGRNESSAEHTWRLCLMLMTFEKELDGLDITKLLKMAIIHDLAEAVCGDIAAVNHTPDDNKEQLETQAMWDLCSHLPQDIRETMFNLWLEYNEGQTNEARFLKGFDKLETIIQHNQGENPPNFNYDFNLDYGKQYMDFHPLLMTLRERIDQKTRDRSKDKT